MLVRLISLAFFVSAAVLGFEIALMRMLLVASWHHFAFLVISIALLGFGASGTALCLGRARVLRHGEGILLVLALLTIVTMPLAAAVAQHVPVEARVAPAVLGRQLGAWVLFWIVLAVPFLFGAAAIGLALMLARERVAAVYSANLVGSAAGAVLVTALMPVVPPAWLPIAMSAAALPAAAAFARCRRRTVIGGIAAAIVVVAAVAAVDPPHVRLDPYKYGAYVEQLERQGLVRRRAVGYGARGVVEVDRGDVFHELPFLSVDAPAPPRLDAILVDGHWSASMLRVGGAEEAGVVERTLTAVPYDLAPPDPAVLLLGESGGANVWLAARRGASSIDVVQPNGTLLDLLRGPLRDDGGEFLDLPGVHVAGTDPRHFLDHLDHAARHHDLVQLVALEAMTAGSGGVGGLAENHLVTVEGLGAGLRALADGGMITVARGIQTPPRDNLKLLATFAEALRRRGIERPQDHVVILRDYLAVLTMVKRTPWTDADIARVRSVCADRRLTPVWFRGVREDELNRPDAMPGPSESPATDWYHLAATRLFAPGASEFIDAWRYDIRPPTDDRPFFLDFCRLRAIGALREAFGDLWLTRAELAYLFALAALTAIGAAGALLTLLPLALLREVRRAPGKIRTAAYFGAIGLGYMLLEMVMLSRLTHLIGDPVHAAAVTIASFLLFSGAGSWLAGRLGARGSASGRPPIATLILALVVVASADLAVFVPASIRLAGGAALGGRIAAGVLALAPLAVLMGFPMPTGLARLDRTAPALIPWAWGVNGFASVLAAPLAIVVAMAWGYDVAAGLALAAYLAAALAGGRGERGNERTSEKRAGAFD